MIFLCCAFRNYGRFTRLHFVDDFDLDDVWSIKRNMNVPNQPAPAPPTMDGWSKNVGKGFYSRHGGLNSGYLYKEFCVIEEFRAGDFFSQVYWFYY
jgi:hypothetical protein